MHSRNKSETLPSHLLASPPLLLSSTVGITAEGGGSSHLVRRRSIVERISGWLGRGSESSSLSLAAHVPPFEKKVQKRDRKGTTVYDVGGKKTITTWGGYIYILNQFLDYLPSLPFIILSAGWLPSLIVNVSICLISTFIALMILRAMTMIQGNQNFELRYEYVPTVRYFLGHTPAIGLEIGFHVLQVLNFLAINNVARLIDIMLLKSVGLTIGIHVFPYHRIHIIKDKLEDLYSTSLLTISLGYVLCGLVCIPLCHYNLDEGITAQRGILGIAITTISVVSFMSLGFGFPAEHTNSSESSSSGSSMISSSMSSKGVLGRSSESVLSAALRGVVSYDPVIGCCKKYETCNRCVSSLCVEFSRQFDQCPMVWNSLLQRLVSEKWTKKVKTNATTARLPLRWGRKQFQQTFAIFISGYSFTNTIPSWANELQSDVEIPNVLWRGTLTACVVFFAFGYLLAYSFPDIEDEDALQNIVERYSVPSIFAYSVYSLELVTVALGVVVNCVASRYNLTNSGKCRSASMAFFFGCVCPFLFAWIFAGPLTQLKAFLGWASLILSFTCNFVAPAWVYIVACKTSPLAYRNPVRNKSIRLDIEFFKPKHGNIEDVQEGLRRWALAKAKNDIELRALLESRHLSCGSNMNFNARALSSHSSLVGGPDDVNIPSLSSQRESCTSFLEEEEGGVQRKNNTNISHQLDFSQSGSDDNKLNELTTEETDYDLLSSARLLQSFIRRRFSIPKIVASHHNKLSLTSDRLGHR